MVRIVLNDNPEIRGEVLFMFWSLANDQEGDSRRQQAAFVVEGVRSLSRICPESGIF